MKHSSGLLPLVSKDVIEIKESLHVESVKVEEFEKESKAICGEGKKGSYASNESSTSQSEEASTTVSAEGMNIGWGRWYSLKELGTATYGFADENVIGEGGYGIVYRGVLQDGSVVAVKNLLNNK